MKQYRKLWNMDHFHTIVIDGKDGGEDRWILMNTGQTERSEQLRRGEIARIPTFGGNACISSFAAA